MSDIDRRSAFALGLMTVAFASRAAGAQTPNEGRLIAPGVRVVNVSERASLLPAYKTLKMRDVVIQPGAAPPDSVMMNDMLCHMTEGELAVQQDKMQFVARKGDVWSCAKGVTTEGTRNHGTTVAVMRIIDLLPA
jgi:quercetin dioxygenase-like cupin family protein